MKKMKYINNINQIQGLGDKIIHEIHSVIFILNGNREIIFASPNVESIFNLTVDNIMNKVSCTAIECINSSVQHCPGCKINQAIRKLLHENEPTKREEVEFRSHHSKVVKYLEITVLGIEHDSERLIVLIFDDLTEKKLLYKEIERHSLELKARVAELEAITQSLEEADKVIMTIANTIEAKDMVTQGHTQRVAYYSREIGTRLGLSEEDLEILRKGCILHDVGKVGIPDHILKKPNILTIEEFAIMKEHPVIGEHILKPLKSAQEVSRIVRHHHERINGTGYPDGLKGDELDILVRIAAVVDVYDALAMDRPYRKRMPREKAMAILQDGVEKGWWDAEVVKVMDEVSQKSWNLFHSK